MTTKPDKFISDVRHAAWQEQKPRTMTVSDLLDPAAISKALRRLSQWLTPQVADEYDPNEFANLPGDQKNELDEAVKAFRNSAERSHAGQPASDESVREGLKTFGRLKTAIQKVTLVDWESAANALIRRVEDWANESGWITRRESKILTETLLGSYRLDRLYLHAEGNLYILDPLARFVAGGSGTYELSIQPSSNTNAIYRHSDGTWRVLLRSDGDPEVGEGDPLSKELFVAAIRELRSQL